MAQWFCLLHCSRTTNDIFYVAIRMIMSYFVIYCILACDTFGSYLLGCVRIYVTIFCACFIAGALATWVRLFLPVFEFATFVACDALSTKIVLCEPYL